MDLLGQAIIDYYNKKSSKSLWVFDTFGQRTKMNTSVYFRDFDLMPQIEQKALELCRGSVLDIGAGAGSHSLYLQKQNLDVTALDISEKCMIVAQKRGVNKTVVTDFFNWNTPLSYDTLLLLMNGIGICEDIYGFSIFLDKAKKILNPGGQLIFDSSDIAYMYDPDEFPEEQYYGEFICAYGYQKQKTDWFSWLYIDFNTMQKIATEKGWNAEKIAEDDHYHFLARLTLNRN